MFSSATMKVHYYEHKEKPDQETDTVGFDLQSKGSVNIHS